MRGLSLHFCQSGFRHVLIASWRHEWVGGREIEQSCLLINLDAGYLYPNRETPGMLNKSRLTPCNAEVEVPRMSLVQHDQVLTAREHYRSRSKLPCSPVQQLSSQLQHLLAG